MEGGSMKRKNDVTAGNAAETMSSPSWSELSSELLALISDQIADTQALDNWCEATRGNRRLHEIAMAARWRTVTVDDRDLLPAPGGDEKNFEETQEIMRRHNLGQNWRPAGEMVDKLLGTVGDSSPCPAHYVQNLVLDLRLLRYWEDDSIQNFYEEVPGDYEEGDDGITINVWDLMPSMLSLKHTLFKLRGQFHNLRHVTCWGHVPTTILSFIASQDVSRLHSLEIRKFGEYGHFKLGTKDSMSAQRLLRGTFPLLTLNMLLDLPHLESLDIHRLLNRETTGLLSAFAGLTKLRSLTLACEADEHDHDYGGCALKFLFEQIFKDQDTADAKPSLRLPPNLESLSLIDTDHSRTAVMPSTPPVRLGNRLTHLCVDTGDVNWIPLLLDCFPECRLQSLSVPGRLFDGHQLYRGDHRHVKHALSRHKQSLNRIELLRAWNTDRGWIDKLNDLCRGEYAVHELVLGTSNPEWYTLGPQKWRELVPAPSFSFYLYGFIWDYCGETGRWGSDIRRIRIDHFDFSDLGLDVSVLAESFYVHLKILMLQPAPRDTISTSLATDETIDEKGCAQLAQHIVAHGAPSLRVLVIARRWYWISAEDGAGGGRTLWTWGNAKEDAAQNKAMSSILDEADLDFLERSTVPLWHERDSKEWHRNRPANKKHHPYKPSYEMLHQWNYLTLLPARKG